MQILKRFFLGCMILNLVACAASLHRQTAKNPTAASYNMELGINYLHQGDRVRAKHKLLLALQQAPEDPMVLDAMAYFMEKSGNPENADGYYRQALKFAPHSGEAQNNYGTFLCRQGKYLAAINHFLLAVKDPSYLHTAKAYENAGRCALKIPDKKLAQAYFSRALAADPKLNHDVSISRFLK